MNRARTRQEAPERAFCDELIPTHMQRRLMRLNAAEREEWEERAAIMEFDGRMSREEAEEAAFQDLFG